MNLKEKQFKKRCEENPYFADYTAARIEYGLQDERTQILIEKVSRYDQIIKSVYFYGAKYL